MRTREEKAQMIADLKQRLSEYNVIYFVDILGLDAKTTYELRKASNKSGIKLQVVKNTLVAKAMHQSDKDFENLESVLHGSTALMLSDVGNKPARLIKEFRKNNDKPVLKGAWIDEGVYVGEEYLEFLTSIKSKEELLGDIIGLLQSPIKNVLSALQSGGQTITGILKTLSEKEN
jgi:large subunit ribosomal protein L10